MPDRLYPEGRPALTATVNLAGSYEPSIDTHSEGAGAHISLGLGMIVLVFLDQAAAEVYRRAWLTEMSLYRRMLPAQVTLDKTAAPPIGLTARIRGTETYRARLDGHGQPMVIRIGAITWVCHDQTAYDALSGAIAQVVELARLILPDRY